ncbi:hypothetical protein LSCM1_01564 [Leishmania martiniquensis]|uniref:2Fe-2S ferredoxin-type domain-containing protein n=1 Tax=Leishmania martiniquensis TaxID=1580590 RepID=A0A836GG12_9TRYP|nr:hypothetical protein LSCM1_01564 [Leishmania martiniquensis]
MMFARRCDSSLVTSPLRGGLIAAMMSIKLSRALCSSVVDPSTLSATPSSSTPPVTPGKVRVLIRTSGGAAYERLYNEGDNLMEALRDDHSLPVEVPGACNGTCQCSTCHVRLHSAEWMREVEGVFAITDAEQDCLDKALDVSDTSRLSCQLTLTRKLNGIEIDLPERTLDVRWQAAFRRSTHK